jgi:predicted nucleic acid-binding protein
MVLVDTTVWIDYFASRSTIQAVTLEQLINDRKDLCICGIILTEVLQGIRKDSDFIKIHAIFNNLLFLPMPYAVFIRSAKIYRKLRRKGITIRKSLDCMIASVALENDIPLLHNDWDFKPIEKHFGLKFYNPIMWIHI